MTALPQRRLDTPHRSALPASARRPLPDGRHAGTQPAPIRITRLDQTARLPDLVLYRIHAEGQEHLLYPDEIHDRFGIAIGALPEFCENS